MRMPRLHALTAFVLLFAVVQVAHAQTVTVTDMFAPHSTYLKWDQFSTDLQASVSGSPTPQQECQITSGPTWTWSAPPSGFRYTGDTTSDHVTLQSLTPSKTVTLRPGQNTISITATAQWSDTCGNSYSQPGNVSVKFWVVVPVSTTAAIAGVNGPIRGASCTFSDGLSPDPAPGWGYLQQYKVFVLDNQTPPQLYGNGVVHEELHVSGGGSVSGNDTFGLQGDGTGSVLSSFLDTNALWTRNDPGVYTGLIGSYTQSLYDMELTPPYNQPNGNLFVTPNIWRPNSGKPPALLGDFLSNVNSTPLTPSYTLTIYYDPISRP